MNNFFFSKSLQEQNITSPLTGVSDAYGSYGSTGSSFRFFADVVPPFSMRWMRSRKLIEQHFQVGKLPKGAASVVFKVPSKAVGKKLLTEMWVAGNKFRALPYIPDKADTLCSICSQWGHSEFRCQKGTPTCAICAGPHRTSDHRCEVATCGRVGKICGHTTMKCANCGGKHLAQDT